MRPRVVYLGKEGTQDWNLMRLIAEGNFVFATNNRSDFLKRYAETELHNGLIVIVPSVDRQAQLRLFHRALDEAEKMPDTVNKLIEVHEDGTATAQDWTSDQSTAQPKS